VVTDYKQQYYDDTLKLAMTLVIKSSVSAELLNTYVKLVYGASMVDITQPATWKYYMNISGEYHPTDTLMTVTSLDTLTTIDFTKDNLAIHTATAEAYGYGSRYYYNLLNRYPEQEQLILGILYPANKQQAMAADDGTILAYPTELVENQEVTLLAELEAWIKRYLIRWDVKAFRVTDTLYATAQHAILYHNVFMKLFNLRNKRLRTNEVHSFHVRSYLASHNGLDRYYDYMSLKQQLFLYRNLNYLDRHSGQKETFEWLIEKIMTERGIPLAEFEARLTGDFDDTYYPGYYFMKHPLNTTLNTPDKNLYTLHDILAKEKLLLPTNETYLLDQESVIDSQFKNANKSVIPTKLLESSMFDTTDAVVYPFTEILMNHWAYMASSGMYRSAVSFKDPQTGETRALMCDDAFIFMQFVMLKALGIKVSTIGPVFVKRVLMPNKPTSQALLKVVDQNYIKDSVIADWLVALQPKLSKCLSISAFHDFCLNLYNVEQQEWYLVSRTEHYERRTAVANMVRQFYGDGLVQFSTHGQTYSSWFTEKGLPELDYTTEEAMQLMTNIFRASTGYTVNSNNLPVNIQKAMVGILLELSSYSIQISRTINTLPIKPINLNMTRLGDIKAKSAYEANITDEVIVMSTSVVAHQTEQVSSNFSDIDTTVVMSSQQSEDLNLKSPMKANLVMSDIKYVNLRSFSITADYANKSDASNEVAYIGYEDFLALTDTQKQSVIDIYNPQLSLTIMQQDKKQNLADMISNTDLTSFVYRPIATKNLSQYRNLAYSYKLKLIDEK
jgi:hypothetical protein